MRFFIFSLFCYRNYILVLNLSLLFVIINSQDMKTTFTFLFGITLMMSFSNCANSKKLQEQQPVALEQVYYTTWPGGAKDKASGINLFIPVKNIKHSEVHLDSVYFRGRAAELKKEPRDTDVYIANFRTTSEEKASDLVMSSDPREEYGNQPPEIVREFPFELREDEAVVSYKKDGKTNYYKITGIVKKDRDDKEIKYPENIRH